MMPFHRLPIAALGAAFCALAPLAAALAQDEAPQSPPAEAAAAAPSFAPPPEFRIDESGWQGGAFLHPNSQHFSHCGISREYDNGVTVIFSMNLQGQTNIGLLKQDWNFAEHQQMPVHFVLDQAIDAEVPGIAANPKVLVIPTGANGQVIEALKKGSVLKVSGEFGDLEFPLTGTLKSLTQLQGCIEAARTLIASHPELAPVPETPPRTLMSPQALATMLQGAGISDVEFVPADQVPQDTRGLIYQWHTDGVTGGLHQEPRTEAVEIDHFADTYIKVFEDLCTGGAFTKQVGDTVVFEELYAIKTAELDCADASQPTHVSLLFALDDFNYSAFFHEAPADQQMAAELATAKLAAFIRGMAAGGSGGVANSAPAQPPRHEESSAEPTLLPGPANPPPADGEAPAPDQPPSSD